MKGVNNRREMSQDLQIPSEFVTCYLLYVSHLCRQKIFGCEAGYMVFPTVIECKRKSLTVSYNPAMTSLIISKDLLGLSDNARIHIFKNIFCGKEFDSYI